MWTNITDEDIEKADDEVMQSDEGMGGDMSGMGDMFGGNGHEDDDERKDTQNNPEGPQNEKQEPYGDFPKAMKGKDPELKKTADKKPWKEEEHRRNKYVSVK